MPISATSQQEFSDADFRIVDNGDQSKKLAFEVSGIATATTRTWTVPDANVTVTAYAGALLGSAATRNFWLNSGIGYELGSMADDSATFIDIGATAGVGFICLWVTNVANGGLFAGRVAATSNALNEIAKTTSPTVEYTTGVLAGTTGTDGRLIFSANTNGRLYIENRTGGALPVYLYVLKLVT